MDRLGGRVALVDIRDVAAVCVAALIQDNHAGVVYAATGPVALSFDEVAEAISNATGRVVNHERTSIREVGNRMLAGGSEPWFAEAICQLFLFYRDGGGATVTADVERVTGRPAMTLQRFVADNSALFATDLAS